MIKNNYIYMYVCVYTYMYIYTYICVCVYVCACTITCHVVSMGEKFERALPSKMRETIGKRTFVRYFGGRILHTNVVTH